MAVEDVDEPFRELYDRGDAIEIKGIAMKYAMGEMPKESLLPQMKRYPLVSNQRSRPLKANSIGAGPQSR